jgi:hypothetical protein
VIQQVARFPEKLVVEGRASTGSSTFSVVSDVYQGLSFLGKSALGVLPADFETGGPWMAHGQGLC